jgi:hypothetical protein
MAKSSNQQNKSGINGGGKTGRQKGTILIRAGQGVAARKALEERIRTGEFFAKQAATEFSLAAYLDTDDGWYTVWAGVRHLHGNQPEVFPVFARWLAKQWGCEGAVDANNLKPAIRDHIFGYRSRPTGINPGRTALKTLAQSALAAEKRAAECQAEYLKAQSALADAQAGNFGVTALTQAAIDLEAATLNRADAQAEKTLAADLVTEAKKLAEQAKIRVFTHGRQARVTCALSDANISLAQCQIAVKKAKQALQEAEARSAGPADLAFTQTDLQRAENMLKEAQATKEKAKQDYDAVRFVIQALNLHPRSLCARKTTQNSVQTGSGEYAEGSTQAETPGSKNGSTQPNLLPAPGGPNQAQPSAPAQKRTKSKAKKAAKTDETELVEPKHYPLQNVPQTMKEELISDDCKRDEDGAMYADNEADARRVQTKIDAENQAEGRGQAAVALKPYAGLAEDPELAAALKKEGWIVEGDEARHPDPKVHDSLEWVCKGALVPANIHGQHKFYIVANAKEHQAALIEKFGCRQDVTGLLPGSRETRHLGMPTLSAADQAIRYLIGQGLNVLPPDMVGSR